MSVRKSSEVETIPGNEGTKIKQYFHPHNTLNGINYSLAQFTLEPGKKSLLLEISHMLKTITQDLALVYSKMISSSGFHAGSTMHKNCRFVEPVFSMYCSDIGGTYTESSFFSWYGSSFILKIASPSKI